jgi:regulatory protein
MARLRSAAGGLSAPPAEPPTDSDHRSTDPDADPETVARAICLRLLTMRARTRTELADALSAREVPDPVAAKVLNRLAEVGLVDDAAFAASFVSSRRNDRGLAAREISRQLRGKGVDEAVVTEAVADIDSDAEREMAKRLATRKLRSMSRLSPEVKIRRLVGLLARKGYSPGLAFQVVREVVGSEVDDTAGADTAWLA